MKRVIKVNRIKYDQLLQLQAAGYLVIITSRAPTWKPKVVKKDSVAFDLIF